MPSKLYKFLIILLSNFTIFECAQMTWKEASLPKEISIAEKGKSAVVSSVSYEEKAAWNPLQGTTEKRNYRTHLEIWEGSSKKSSWVVPHWILADQIYYLTSEKRIVALRGLDDEFGTPNRKLVFWDESGKEVSALTIDPELLFLEISPSPDGRYLALVSSKLGSTGLDSSAVLEIFEKEKSQTKKEIREWLGAPLTAIRWIGNKLYVREGEVVSEWEGKNSFSPSKRFPSCFFPSTDFGKKAYPDASFSDQGWVPGKAIPPPRIVSSPSELEDCF